MPVSVNTISDVDQIRSVSDTAPGDHGTKVQPVAETIDEQFDRLNAQLQHIVEAKTGKPVHGTQKINGDSTDSVRSLDVTPGLTPGHPATSSSASDKDSDVPSPERQSYFVADPGLVEQKLDQVKRSRREQLRSSTSPTDTASNRTSLSAAAQSIVATPEAVVGSRTRPRSSSSSALDRVEPTLAKVRRSSSVPDITAINAQSSSTESSGWFDEEARQKTLVLPPTVPSVPEPGQRPHERGAEADIEDIESAGATRVTLEEETEANVQSKDSKTSLWGRSRAWYRRVYAPIEAPPLVLPTAPSDAEKVIYLKTNRLGLHGLGVLAFCSLSTGMWLFVVSSVAFYWFGAFVAFLQIYMIVSYFTSVCGGEFDMEEHERIVRENPIDPVTAPHIDIYLPVCMEPMVILENTWKHVQALQWPEGKIKVWVLDDGASDEVKAMAADFGYNYILRDNRPHLKKAGNLRYAFARTDAPFFAIFDADFCPRPDFLKEIMPEHLANPDTCIVQTPQYFRTTSDQSWVEQGAGAIQEIFYRVVQTNRNKWGASVCVGSNAIYRRESLVEVGGTAEIGFSEDVHTGFYAMCRGWKLRYLPLCLACGVCPDTPRAYFSQQMRWAMGSTTLVTNPEFWKSPLNRMQKICFLCGLLYYTAITLSIFMAPLPGMLLLWVRPEFVRYYNLAFAIPSVLYGILVVRCWAKAEYGFNVQFIQQIQMYAYAAAIKKRILGRGLTWVASGDSKVHKSNEFREMRVIAWVWNIIIVGLIVAGSTYQILRNRIEWYDTLPLMVLTAFNLFLAHRLLLWHGKI